ncbi:hypothetical protein NQ317_015395 [Molorchus minor]|uniref:Dehydrogenase/reductase SDR family member 11 n=1 Tax=Molorchus minor TaxID=1323400 RepID=A0ABQ9ITA0_9CUCU|nr:hypothetical protein NQ317_015395 [Molorchus minor]
MVLSMGRWVGKVAIVTGASSGIGAAIAQQLVKEGLKVAALARRRDKLEVLATKLYSEKGKLYPITTDVSKEEDILNAFRWIKENLGPVHILINNAGIFRSGDLSEGDTEDWKSSLNVNVIGLCIATREAIRDMKANKVDGHIIHINSIVGHNILALPGWNIYPASKFAITALAETLRVELKLAKSKIKITSLSPGPVHTEILPDSIMELIERMVEQKEILESEDIADAVIYVLSTPSSCTGTLQDSALKNSNLTSWVKYNYWFSGHDVSRLELSEQILENPRMIHCFCGK